MKDHKPLPDDQEHPKTREVCSATDGPLSRVEYLTSLWLDPIADGEYSKSECISMENMKSRIYDTNNVPVDDGSKRVIVSHCIQDMYPSLDKAKMKEMTYYMVRHSKVVIDNFDWKEAMLYIDKHVDKTRTKSVGLSKLLPTISGNNISWYQTNPGVEIIPNQIQIRRMQGLVA